MFVKIIFECNISFIIIYLKFYSHQMIYFCMKLDMDYTNDGAKFNTKDICIPDSGTTHTILKHKRYFSDLKLTKTIINTISGLVDLNEGTGKASFILPNGTKIFIKDVLFLPKFKRNLLSFNDISSWI